MKLNLVTHKTRFGLCATESAAWAWFYNHCLMPRGLTFANCTVCDVDDIPSVLNLPKADFNIFLGNPASVKLAYNPLLKHRGVVRYPQPYHTPTVVTFNPQEAYDMRTIDPTDEEDDTISARQEKDGMSIAPKSWRYLMKFDIDKLFSRPKIPEKPLIYLNPDLGRLTDYLNRCKGQRLYLDIECRIEDCTLDCIGLAVDESPVAVVTIWNHLNKLHYQPWELRPFLAALFRAMSRNTVVVHNGFFDLWVLCYFYHFPLPENIWDTMHCQHRRWPEIEKSLGVAVSMWTNLTFHKDQYCRPKSARALDRLKQYNALDVHATREIHKAQLLYGCDHDGYLKSCQQVNASMPAYLRTSLQGIPVDEALLQQMLNARQRRVLQYMRVWRLFMGKTFNPMSAQQCVDLIHHKMHMPVVNRSRKTKAPTLDSKAIYRLRVKTTIPLQNDILDAIIKTRLLVKEVQTLTFVPYEQDSLKATYVLPDYASSARDASRSTAAGRRLASARRGSLSAGQKDGRSGSVGFVPKAIRIKPKQAPASND